MQSYHSIKHQSAESPNGLLHTASVVQGANYPTSEESAQIVSEPIRFCSQFVDSMDLFADRRIVTEYFDNHHEWFRRCAQPMQVEAIAKNSYALTVGKFGSLGYEVEPKIGLDLLPQQEGVYRIETVPVPDYSAAGYEIDFQAAMELVELPAEQTTSHLGRNKPLPDKVTRVQWQLDLAVAIQFPRFIHALPPSLVHNTGDRLLKQIVRQVSTRLTHKVLEDFHKTHSLPIPKHSKRWFFRRLEVDG